MKLSQPARALLGTLAGAIAAVLLCVTIVCLTTKL